MSMSPLLGSPRNKGTIVSIDNINEEFKNTQEPDSENSLFIASESESRDSDATAIDENSKYFSTDNKTVAEVSQKQETKLQGIYKFISTEGVKIVHSCLFGGLYYAVAYSGMKTILNNFFPNPSDAVRGTLLFSTFLSSSSHIVTLYEVMTHMDPLPSPAMSALALVGSSIPALPFGFSGLKGSELLGWSQPFSTICGAGLTAYRTRWIADGLIKLAKNENADFPNPVGEILSYLMESPEKFEARFPNRKIKSNHWNLAANLWTVLPSIPMSLCDIDNTYLSLLGIASFVGIQPSQAIDIFTFSLGCYGASVSYFSTLCWSKKIIEEIFAGEFKNHSWDSFLIKNVIALLWSVSVMIGPIGAIATPSSLEGGKIITPFFGKDTPEEIRDNALFRIVSLSVILLPFLQYIHFKTINNISEKIKHHFQSDPLEELSLEPI